MRGSRNRPTRSMAFASFLTCASLRSRWEGVGSTFAIGSAATTTGWPPSGSRYMPSTSPPSALMASAVRRATSCASAISATVRPLLLAACLFRGGLRFLVEPALGFFAGMPLAYHQPPSPPPPPLPRPSPPAPPQPGVALPWAGTARIPPSWADRAGVCLIPGGGPGTGPALPRRFASGGYRVALLARTRERLAELERELPGSRAFACDVGDPEALSGVLDEVRRTLGHPEVVIHNAVAGSFGTFHDIDPADLERNFRVNVVSLLHLA